MRKYFLLFTAAVFLLAGCTAKNDKLFKEAVELNKAGKTEAALKVYNTILRNDPNFYSALANRAIIYEKLGEVKMAEDDYKKALGIFPNQPEVLNNIGAFYITQKRPTLALYYLNRAVEINPNYYLGLVNRSVANQSLGYLNSAAEDLDRAIEILPNNLLAVTNKAIVDYQRFNYEAAIQGYTKALYYDSRDAKNFYRRGMAFRMAGKYANALNDFSMALNLQPSYIAALYARAEMLFKSGDYQAAIADLDNLKGINNQYAPSYELAGDILAIEDPVASTANYMVAKKLDPSNGRRYDAKIALMRTDKGRQKVIARTFTDQ